MSASVMAAAANYSADPVQPGDLARNNWTQSSGIVGQLLANVSGWTILFTLIVVSVTYDQGKAQIVEMEKAGL